MNILEVYNANFSYEGTTVLKDVNFNVGLGDYLCIVGENGSGKSTLVKGLLKMKSPDKGSIVYGKDLDKKQIGYLSQSTNIQKDFPASVQEVVMSGLLSLNMSPFYTRVQKDTARQKMDQLGVLELRKKCFRDLSGGQQQRVLLARALCSSVKLIVMDEPVVGLDPVIAADMYEIFRELNETEGLTIIMVSHDVKNGVRNAKHILHLDNRQLFWGTAAEYAEDTVGRAYLERS